MGLPIVCDIPQFGNFIQIYGPMGIFLWFLTFDNITPLPAEISLLIVGYFAAHGAFNPVLAGAACFAGLISIDIIYFLLTGSGNKFIMRLFEKRKGRYLEKYKEKMKTKMPQTLIILIFIPRMRMFGPILASITKCSFKKFLIYDAAGLAGFVFIFVLLGMVFHESLETLIKDIDLLRHLIFGICMIGISVLLIFLIRRWRIRSNSKN